MFALKNFYKAKSFLNPINNSRSVNLLFQAQTYRFSAFVNHRDTEDNKEDTPFEFTPENYEKIKYITDKYPTNYRESAVIPVLFIAQKQNNNFLTLSAMNKVAKVLGMQPMQVYEVASFYTMFNRTKVGKYHLQVCGTTPCMLRGARDVIQAIKEHAGIEMDETSEDGLFTLSEVECLGACVNAPMIQVNNEWFYEDLTPESMKALIDKWKNGEDPQVGPQINRQHSCGPQGRTSLHQPQDHQIHDRDFASEKQKYEEAKKEAAAKAAAAKK